MLLLSYYYGGFQTPYYGSDSFLRRVKHCRGFLFPLCLEFVSRFVLPVLFFFVWICYASTYPLRVRLGTLSFLGPSSPSNPWTADISTADFYSHPMFSFHPCAFVLPLLLRSNPRTFRFTVEPQSQSSTFSFLASSSSSSSAVGVISFFSSFSIFSVIFSLFSLSRNVYVYM